MNIKVRRNYYVRKGMLLEKDVGPIKLGSKEHTVFKVHIVVPGRIVLFFYFLASPDAQEVM